MGETKDGKCPYCQYYGREQCVHRQKYHRRGPTPSTMTTPTGKVIPLGKCVPDAVPEGYIHWSGPIKGGPVQRRVHNALMNCGPKSESLESRWKTMTAEQKYDYHKNALPRKNDIVTSKHNVATRKPRRRERDQRARQPRRRERDMTPVTGPGMRKGEVWVRRRRRLNHSETAELE